MLKKAAAFLLKDVGEKKEKKKKWEKKTPSSLFCLAHTSINPF